jgi:hypothetical protein
MRESEALVTEYWQPQSNGIYAERINCHCGATQSRANFNLHNTERLRAENDLQWAIPASPNEKGPPTANERSQRASGLDQGITRTTSVMKSGIR